jgi:hypothetical protein
MPGGISRQELAEIGKPDTLSLQWRGPIELYGIFTEIAKAAFSDSSFSNRRWDADEIKSDIYIVPDYTWDDKTVEKRPAIFVSLADITCTSYSGIASEQGCVGINMTGEHGVEHSYGDVKSGSVSWNVLAETRGEALAIVGELARYLNVFQARIAKDFCFTSFVVSQISPLSVVKEARERLQCSVSASFSYEQYWTLVEDAPKVRLAIDVSLAK